jgi:plasmid stability protein
MGVLAQASVDIIPDVKQLLLRVPDELHQRLSQRAEREGRSVNALATEVLAVAASVDPGSRRDRLRLRVAMLGLASPDGPYRAGATTAAERQQAIDSMRGLGHVIDSIIDDGRRNA